jgi:hypothetical protein
VTAQRRNGVLEHDNPGIVQFVRAGPPPRQLLPAPSGPKILGSPKLAGWKIATIFDTHTWSSLAAAQLTENSRLAETDTEDIADVW